MSNGKMEGIGKYQWANCDMYRGTFKDNMRHGKGRHKHATEQAVYEGSYVSDVREGFGIYTYRNGDRYEGNWMNDTPNGRGVVEFANGKKVDGVFQDGKLIWGNMVENDS